VDPKRKLAAALMRLLKWDEVELVLASKLGYGSAGL